MASPSVTKSSANLVRSMIASGSPAVSAIAADSMSHHRSAFMAPTPRRVVSDGAFARGPAVDASAATAQRSSAVDEEREYLVRRLAEVEAAKEHELDHLRIRVSTLTTRVAELEASMNVAHRALEEEAATAMGLQRRVDVLQLRFAMGRWRERMTKRNLVRLAHQAATFVDGVDAAARVLPSASGACAPPIRKALEELTWCERQWAEHRIAYLQRTLDAFRFGGSGTVPLHASHSASPTKAVGSSGIAGKSPSSSASPASPSRVPLTSASASLRAQPADPTTTTAKDMDRAVASMLASAKTLVERAEAITSARFHLLQQIFVGYTKCDEGKRQLEDAVLRFRSATGATAAASSDGTKEQGAASGVGVVPPNLTAASTTGSTAAGPRSSSMGALMRAAAYDVVRDGFGSAVTVVVVPPLLHLAREAAVGCAVLPRVLDAIEEMLLQQPLTVQVEQHLKTLLTHHFALHSVQAGGRGGSGVVAEDTGRRVSAADAATEVARATFFLEAPLKPHRMSQASAYASSSEVRQLLYHPSAASSSTVSKQAPPAATPAQKPLRWDLVHSALDDDDTQGGDGLQQQKRRAGMDDGLRRYQQALQDSTEDQTSSSRLQRARRSLMQFNRSSML